MYNKGDIKEETMNRLFLLIAALATVSCIQTARADMSAPGVLSWEEQQELEEQKRENEAKTAGAAVIFGAVALSAIFSVGGGKLILRGAKREEQLAAGGAPEDSQ